MKKLILFLSVSILLTNPVFSYKAATLLELKRPFLINANEDHLYITDGPNVFIHSLIDYRLVKQFGKAGEGPEEFRVDPHRSGGSVVTFLQSDNIVVNSIGKVSFFSTDGEYILTGSRDKTARLWDLNGNHLQTFLGHTGTVRDVLFSPDHKFNYVLTASDDETARLWEIRMPLAEFLKKGLCEKLSQEQKIEYGIDD